ncbi:MAG: ParB/RepB/Spo0J family partition protein [Patescibacteria group bacterium]|nr:ParB/RepB/Spo0J family partition protein [Patescibacteria group bacterium]
MRSKENKEELIFKDPYNQLEIKFKVVPIDKLSVIAYQRKPSAYHIKHLTRSIERLGFIVPVVVIEKESGDYLIIDGQHRFLAAKELGIRYLPVIIVPSRISQLMINLNVEKELNIRERASVSFAIYEKYLDSKPEMLESDAELIDSLEQIYYVTLGIAYHQKEKVMGSVFEPILKKCDYFLDENLSTAYQIRKNRAEKIILADDMIKEIAQKLKDLGKWHPYVYQQIVSFANPYKRKRLLTEFDELFNDFMENLNNLNSNPEQILQQELDNF